MRVIFIVFHLLIMLSFSGCLLKQSELNYELNIPQNFTANDEETGEISSFWWREYNSKNLDNLVKIALENSPDLLSAYEKINQAKLLLQNANAAYKPSIDASAGSSKNITKNASHNTTHSNGTNIALSLSYELDVWGKIRSSIELQEANLNFTKYDFDALKLTLISNVTTTYFEYLALEQRVKIAKENLDIAEQIYKIVQSKYTNGITDKLDISRQKQLLLSSESSLSTLKTQKELKLNALALLVGVHSSELVLNDESLEMIAFVKPKTTLPSQLLLKRPDVAASLSQLEASKSSIDIARAAKLPSFSLSASGGVASAYLLSLINPAYSVGAGLGMGYNLFDDGELENKIQIERSKSKALVQNYKNSVLVAFKEVNDALLNISLDRGEVKLYEQMLSESKISYDIAKIKYENGSDDLNSMLDVQKSYFNSKDSMISQKLSYLVSLVELNKSLGGGWSKEDGL